MEYCFKANNLIAMRVTPLKLRHRNHVLLYRCSGMALGLAMFLHPVISLFGTVYC